MTITEKYTLPGVQRLIQQLMDVDGLSPMQLSRQAGLHFTTLYGILKRKENTRRRPIRRATIMALGKNLGYEVNFDHSHNEISFTRPDIKPSKSNDIDELVQSIRSVLIQSGRKEFGPQEKQRIVNVVRAMVG